MSGEDAYLYEAIKAGASGYLLKETSMEEIASAIRSVRAGVSRISPSMATKLLAEFAAMSRREARVPPPGLTPRETDVLGLLAQGRGNRAIGEELAISHSTVNHHVHNILAKFHLHSRMEALAYAVKEGLIALD